MRQEVCREEASQTVPVKTCPNCGHASRDDDRFCASCGQPTDIRRQTPRAPVEERPRRAAAPPAPAPAPAPAAPAAPAAASPSNVRVYANALRRFWWVLVIGAVAALFAGLSARYSVSLFPPGLEEKDQVTYTSETQLLVSSAENPYIRSQKTFNPTSDNEGSGATGGEEPSADGASPLDEIPITSAPDLNTLVRTANLYPFVIESDDVAAYRREKYGDLPGSISALGVTSVVTANRIELSEIPVIRLVAVADSPDDAVGLANKTATAFIGWLGEQQKAAKILPEDRIVVEQLTVPHGAIPSGGSSKTLPILVFLVVFAAFCVLAVLLDYLIPARPRRDHSDVEPVEPVEVKKTA
jgi:zinc ribbon protein